jgi:hypothetical protein
VKALLVFLRTGILNVWQPQGLKAPRGALVLLGQFT